MQDGYHHEDRGMVFFLNLCFLAFVEVGILIVKPRLHGRTVKGAHSISGQAILIL